MAGRTFNAERYTEWLRPVSTRPGHEISSGEQQYADGSTAQLLDFFTVTLSQHQPLYHQTENHVIATVRWAKHSDGTWADVVIATETHTTPLWHDGVHSYHGTNDKVPEAVAKTLTNSLLLIEPQKLALVVAIETRYGGGHDRRVRADFTLNNTAYNFVVTDPWIEAKYFAMANGRYEIPTSRLCLSLAELLGDHATKLVAAVITPANVGERR